MGDHRRRPSTEDLAEVVIDELAVPLHGVALALGLVGEPEPGKSSTQTRCSRLSAGDDVVPVDAARGEPVHQEQRGSLGSPNSEWKILSRSASRMGARGTHSKKLPAASHSSARPAIIASVSARSSSIHPIPVHALAYELGGIVFGAVA